VAQDRAGLATIGAAAVAPVATYVAAGPISLFISATTLAAGYGYTAASAVLSERAEIKKAQKAQFYFLHGTRARLDRRQQ
jgi:putative Ca2+/H+ antiporter (TMEM165/GDT1 family)